MRKYDRHEMNCEFIRVFKVKSDLNELETLMKQASRKYVQDMLSLEIRKLEIQLSKLQEDKVTAQSTVVQSENKRYQVKLNGYGNFFIRFCFTYRIVIMVRSVAGWDQSDKFIKIFVTLKNAQTVPTENVFCNLTDNSMELHVKDLDNKDYVLVINKLLKPINVKNSHWKQKTGALKWNFDISRRFCTILAFCRYGRSVFGKNWSRDTLVAHD